MTVHVVGAGLAGLACALALTDAGSPVVLMEAGPAGGGRARSYDDRELGMRIDNGNHLLLSGNAAAQAWLRRLGTTETMAGPGRALFPFFDLASGERWAVRPGRGRLPFWIADAERRVPGARIGEYLGLARWLRVRPGATVAQVAGNGALFRRLIEPLAIASLNTMPEEGDAGLMAAVMRQSLLRGGDACIPAFPRVGLSESLVDPAIDLIRGGGGVVQFGRRATGLVTDSERVTGIATTDGPVELAAGDSAVLAVPAAVAATLLPGLVVPDAFESILNLHYRIGLDPGPAGFIGVVGGLAEWFFFKAGLTSVTISAANRYADRANDAVAAAVWQELGRIRTVPAAMPAWRVVREKRATFAATPAQAARRPPTQTRFGNLMLAGDWTDTGLPATIEGALRSGAAAARKVGALPRTPLGAAPPDPLSMAGLGVLPPAGPGQSPGLPTPQGPH